MPYLKLGLAVALKKLPNTFSIWNIQPELETIATHIFFKKNSVLLFNRSWLEEVDGEVIRFDATYKGSAGDKISWPAEKVLHLKNNCKVMLVWNLYDELKKGQHGNFYKSSRWKISS